MSGALQRVSTAALCLTATACAFGPLAYGMVGFDARLSALLGNALATTLVLAVHLPRESAVIVAPSAGLFAGLLSLALFPLGQGPGATLALLLIIAVGILDGMGGTRASGLWAGLRLAASVAVLLILALLPLYGLVAVVMGTLMTLHVGAMAGFDRPRRGAVLRGWPPIAMFVATTAVIWVLALEEGIGIADIAVAFPVASVLLFTAGRLIALWLAPRVAVLGALAEYLRAMWIPLGGFVIGYLFIAAVFAGVYATLHRVDATSFSGIATGSAGEWLVFSIANATTLGDGRIQAVSTTARVVVGVEAVTATCWLIAVFAAVTAHVQPSFSRIAAKREA